MGTFWPPAQRKITHRAMHRPSGRIPERKSSNEKAANFSHFLTTKAEELMVPTHINKCCPNLLLREKVKRFDRSQKSHRPQKFFIAEKLRNNSTVQKKKETHF